MLTNRKGNHKNQMKMMEEAIRQNAEKVQSKWRKIVTGNEKKRIRDHLKEKEEQPTYVKFFDKLGFTFGVINILICQYFLLNIPEYFSIWYSFIIPIILASRFYHFRSLNWHYFLIDFCYFVNLCTLVNLFLVRSSSQFFRVCFIHATGTLPLAIPIWRNSLVFHDYDKIVSVYIHILPCMLYYTLRWYNNSYVNNTAGLTGGVHVCGSVPTLDCTLTMRDYGLAILVYIFWQVVYLYKTEILDLEKFNRNPDLLTSLRWMSKDTKNPLARKVLMGLRKVGIFQKDEDYNSTSIKTKMVFVASQFMITLISLLPSYLIFNSPTGHLLYIGFIFVCSMFNGASFYIEVFSVRYHSHLEKLEEMHKIALEANTVMKQLAELRGGTEKGQQASSSTANEEETRDSFASERSSDVPQSRQHSEEDHFGDISKVLKETATEALRHIDAHTKELLYDHLEELEGDETADNLSEDNSVFDDKNLEKYVYSIEEEDEASLSSGGGNDLVKDLPSGEQSPDQQAMEETKNKSQ